MFFQNLPCQAERPTNVTSGGAPSTNFKPQNFRRKLKAVFASRRCGSDRIREHKRTIGAFDLTSFLVGSWLTSTRYSFPSPTNQFRKQWGRKSIPPPDILSYSFGLYILVLWIFPFLRFIDDAMRYPNIFAFLALLHGPAWTVESFVAPSHRMRPTFLHSTTEKTANNDYNSVYVAKEGGRGATTASQQALEKNLSLGAPPARPSGGHYLTKGGLQVTAHVEPLEFSSEMRAGTSASAIEDLVQQLDEHKGVLLTSSYEFPGRYARWSLGFVDPPLEISGRGSKCTIKALNQRGKVLMPAIEAAMKALQKDEILSEVNVKTEQMTGSGDAIEMVTSRIDVTVVPPPDVGSFSEEERSRQVCIIPCLVSCGVLDLALLKFSNVVMNSLIYCSHPFFRWSGHWSICLVIRPPMVNSVSTGLLVMI
jgi:hypothetical protein